MTEFRVSGKSDLSTGEAENGRSAAPMDVAMEMVTAATSIAAETAGATIFEQMERNKNGKQRWRSEAPAAASDWRSRMERTIRQQAQSKGANASFRLRTDIDGNWVDTVANMDSSDSKCISVRYDYC